MALQENVTTDDWIPFGGGGGGMLGGGGGGSGIGGSSSADSRISFGAPDGNSQLYVVLAVVGVILFGMIVASRK